jgi:hypothetical protein
VVSYSFFPKYFAAEQAMQNAETQTSDAHSSGDDVHFFETDVNDAHSQDNNAQGEEIAAEEQEFTLVQRKKVSPRSCQCLARQTAHRCEYAASRVICWYFG